MDRPAEANRPMPLSAARVTTAADGLPRRRFTVAEVEAMVAAGVMDEDERVELIGGELVPMSPKGIRHEVVKRALLDRWFRARPDEVHLTPETTFRLSEDTYLEPDVVVYPRATPGSRRRTPCSSWKSQIRRLPTTSAARRRSTRTSGSASLGHRRREPLSARLSRTRRGRIPGSTRLCRRRSPRPALRA